jgi:hypothetical protein
MIRALSASSYVASHMFWRYCFLRATGLKRPEKSIYYSDWDEVVQRKGIYNVLTERFFDEEKIDFTPASQKHSDITPVNDPGMSSSLREETKSPKEIEKQTEKKAINERRKRERRGNTFNKIRSSSKIDRSRRDNKKNNPKTKGKKRKTSEL